MVKYRDNNITPTPNAAVSGRSTPTSTFDDDNLQGYGLNFGDKNDELSGEVSVEDKFLTYSTSKLSKLSQGLLQFWTVSLHLCTL
jgi:hypothetical protein